MPVDQPLDTGRMLIGRLGLQRHPEGGWYREIHRSPQQVSRADGAQRAALTVILFLLEADGPSRWHRVRGADESWHFIDGAPLELLLSTDRDQAVSSRRLGFSPDEANLEPVVVVPAGCWQAARSLGAWSLVSCCVGPGFDFDDFDLDAGRPLQGQPPLT